MKLSARLTASVLMAAVLILTGCTKTAGPIKTDFGNVAILVVDDFGFGKRQGAAIGSEKTDTCAAATNDVGSGGAGDDPPPPPYSHGEMVYSVLKNELTAFSALSPGSSTTEQQTTAGVVRNVEKSMEWTYPATGKTVTLRLEALHVDAYTTADVIAGIKSRITALKNQSGTSFQRFVLNLSFVVLPCNMGLWVNGGDQALLSTYATMVGSDPELQKLRDAMNSGQTLTQAVLTNNEFATFRQFTISAFYNTVVTNSDKTTAVYSVYTDQSWIDFMTFANLRGATPGTSSITVIPVGAAGNGAWYSPEGKPTRKQLNFPYAPGLWDGVVSVSANASTSAGPSPSPTASPSGSPGRADYSNSGEVMLDGLGPAFAPGSRGTSFAAPRLSAKEAIWLLKTGLAECNGNRPPLGYVSLGDPQFVSNLTFGSVWKDLDANAWSGSSDPCPDFGTYSELP
jgi:hypothetical protein